MVGIRFSRVLVVAFFGLLLMQGCASTDELFAEYDDKFCVASEYSSQSIHWEPAVYFESNKAKISSPDHARLKANVATLKRLPGHRVLLKGFTDHQASASHNKILSQKRVDETTRYLTEELGLNADRIISASHAETTPLTHIASGPIAKDRRVEMLLLDADNVPVSSRPLLTKVIVPGL